EVSDNRPIVRGDVFENGLKDRIVRQHIFACFGCYLHADGLVKLNGDSPCGEVFVELGNNSLAETWLLEVIRTNGGAENNSSESALHQLNRGVTLGLEILEEGVTIVNDADVKEFQVQMLQQFLESRVLFEHMRMNIDGIQF